MLNQQFITFCDAAESWQIGFQDPASPVMEGMINFHNYIMLFLISIGIIVLWILYKVIINFNEKNNPIPQKFTHSSALEIIWTIIPAVVLIFIAVPSFGLLYSLDELIDPTITLKIIGHQWYWSYEYSDFDGIIGNENLSFDSYLQAESDLRPSRFRLLEVDNKIALPTNIHIRLLITSADVLHCWTVPSFGIKVDACPGRLSQASLFIKREGHYFGQCSEICGVNHGFMPIAVHSLSIEKYIGWLSLKMKGLI